MPVISALKAPKLNPLIVKLFTSSKDFGKYVSSNLEILSSPLIIPPRLRLSISGVTLAKSTWSNWRSIVVDNESLAFARKIIFSSLYEIRIGSNVNALDFGLNSSLLKLLELALSCQAVFLKLISEGLSPKI